MKDDKPVFTLTDSLASCQILTDASYNKVKQDLLDRATEIKTVPDGFLADIATDILKGIKVTLKAVETSRKEVKGPLIQKGREIDSIANGFTEELIEQADRLSRLIGAWQAAERQRREKERRAAEQAAKDAAFLAAAEIRKAKTDEEEQAAIEKAAAIQQTSRQVIANTKDTEPKGAKLRTILKWEVIDIELLFQKFPHLCNIEPNGDLIRATIKTRKEIPGLRIWEEVKAIV
jgi:hypothetical protein